MSEPSQSQEPARAGWLSRVGPLRIMLAVVVLILLPMAFFAGAGRHGWAAVPTYVAPVLVILAFWGLLLDLLMSRVFMSQQEGAARTRYRSVFVLDGLLLLGLLLFWGPYFYGLLQG